MNVIQLQGYLFFGSSVKLLTHIRNLVDGETPQKKHVSSHWRRIWTSLSHFNIHHKYEKVGDVDLDEIKVERRISTDNSTTQLSPTTAVVNNNNHHHNNTTRRHRRNGSHIDLHEFGEKVKGFIDGKTEKTKRKRLSYLIIDFAMVHGIDSTAVSSFNQLVRLASANNITLVFTNMSKEVDYMFRKRKVIGDHFPKVYPDLDIALEWCENKIIKRKIKNTNKRKLTQEFGSQPLQDYNPSFIALLANSLPPSVSEQQIIEVVNRFFRKKKIHKGQALVHSGDMANAIYFVKSGELSYYTTSEDGTKTRLFKTAKGTFAGETAMFLGVPHYMSLEADEDSTVYELTKSDFKKMEEEAPYLAHAVYKSILLSLSLTFNILVFSVRSLR